MTKNFQIGHHSINPLGIGTWLMGGGVYSDKTTYAQYGNEAQEISAIRLAIAHGQNHLDTAQMYGAGHTEEIVGQAIAGFDRSSLFIASKVWKSHATRAGVPAAIRGMLQRLKLQKLDLVYIHSPFPEIPMAEYLAGLNDAIDQGLTTYLGVSNFNLDQLQQAISLSRHPITALQNHFNLLHKNEFPTELQQFCRQHQIAMVAYRPLERKMLADKCTQPTILKLAQKYQRSPAQIALNWLISQPGMVAIPKASQPTNIIENIKSLDFEINDADLKILSALPDEL